jgi:hypothetical protein
MRKGVFAAVGLAFLAAVSWNAAPAQAMAISAPAALKGASEAVKLDETVHCWGNCGWGWGGGYYRPVYYGYRPYYRPYYGYRPYYRPYYGYGYGYRPYYRPYYSYGYGYRPYYRPYYGYGYRPYYRPYGYGYGYYAPRPRFYVGPRVYWY